MLPPGFSIAVFAEVPNARSLALGDNGTVFVSNRRGRSIYAVVPEGDSTRTIEIISRLNTPNGIAIHNGDLYVAEINRVTRYAAIEQNLAKLRAHRRNAGQIGIEQVPGLL